MKQAGEYRLAKLERWLDSAEGRAVEARLRVEREKARAAKRADNERRKATKGAAR